MSLETDAMSKVLERLNEILPLGDSNTRAFAHGNEGSIVPGQYPYAQTFSTTTTPTEGELQTQFEVLTFGLELVSFSEQDTPGTRDTLRNAIEALAVDLTRNPTLSGLVRSSSLERSTIEGVDTERALVTALVTVEYIAEELETGDELLVDLAADIGSIDFVNGTGALSTAIPGAIQCRITTTPSITISAFSTPTMLTNLTGFPSLRFRFYVPEDIRDTLVTFELQLFDSTFAINRYSFSIGFKQGWQEFVIDRDNPSTDGSIDFTDIIAIQFVYFISAVMPAETIVIDRWFATPRDKADVDVALAF